MNNLNKKNNLSNADSLAQIIENVNNEKKIAKEFLKTEQFKNLFAIVINFLNKSNDNFVNIEEALGSGVSKEDYLLFIKAVKLHDNVYLVNNGFDGIHYKLNGVIFNFIGSGDYICNHKQFNNIDHYFEVSKKIKYFKDRLPSLLKSNHSFTPIEFASLKREIALFNQDEMECPLEYKENFYIADPTEHCNSYESSEQLLERLSLWNPYLVMR